MTTSPSTLSDQERIQLAEAEVHATKQLLEMHIKSTAGLAESLAANTAATTRIEIAVEANRVTAAAAVLAVTTSNAEMLGFFNNMKGAFKVFDMVGKLAKPLGYIVGLMAAIAGLWYTVRHGGAPK